MRYIFFFIIFLIPFNILSTDKFKQVQLIGLKIYEQDILLQSAGIKELPVKKDHFAFVSGKINKFLQNNGYKLAQSYLLEETDDRLIIFIDEGRLIRIVFKRLNSIDIIKMKYEFRLKDDIYNESLLIRELNRIKNKYKFSDVKADLIPVVEGDDAYFQLDREFKLPLIGRTRLPFFSLYRPQFYLEIAFIRESVQKSRGFSYNIKTSYSKGIIPNFSYRMPDLVQENDSLFLNGSFGLYYGFDLKFANSPRWTFMELGSDYHFRPMLKKYFTPMMSVSAYTSRASRKDIGLLSYNYLLLNSILSPGITLLQKISVYAGLGGERVFINTPEIDNKSNFTVDIEKNTETWAVADLKFRYSFIPWTLKNTRKQLFNITQNIYFNVTWFSSLTIEFEGDYEFSNLDFFSCNIRYSKIRNTPPFYHEYPVSDSAFRGFMGKSYYTNDILKSSNEYKFSIYRDSIHIGIFIDIVRFRGSGYDLTGTQYGIVAGPAGHFIFLDQFEFNIYFGKDYLFSLRESQYNLHLNAGKKW